MFPQVPHIPKVSAFDTTLHTKNKNGETVVIPCPKGTQIKLSAIALHLSRKLEQQWNKNETEGRFTAKYWHDPNAFNPDRFLGDWDRDAFIPFSTGPRSCIGKRYARIFFHLKKVSGNEYSFTVRFAEIESITTLALMVIHYEISVTENPIFAHETWEQRRDRVMDAVQGTLTVGPTGVPLTFKRRAD